MSRPDNRGTYPAFPVAELSQNLATGETTAHQTAFVGLTFRDYLAAHAPVTLADAVRQSGFTSLPLSDEECRIVFAVLALMRRQYADALLQELDR